MENQTSPLNQAGALKFGIAGLLRLLRENWSNEFRTVFLEKTEML